MKPLLSINPATGLEIRSYNQHSDEEIENILNNSTEAQKNWQNTDLKFKLTCFKQLSEVLSDSKREYSLLMAEEMGKPFKQGIGEIEKCIWLCNYYIENSAKYLEDKKIKTDGQKSFVTLRPLGLVLGIMPWNFPFWQVLRFAVPSIIAGNGAILKHASNVQGCAFSIETSFAKSGFPKHLFQNISIW